MPDTCHRAAAASSRRNGKWKEETGSPPLLKTRKSLICKKRPVLSLSLGLSLALVPCYLPRFPLPEPLPQPFSHPTLFHISKPSFTLPCFPSLLSHPDFTLSANFHFLFDRRFDCINRDIEGEEEGGGEEGERERVAFFFLFFSAFPLRSPFPRLSS